MPIFRATVVDDFFVTHGWAAPPSSGQLAPECIMDPSKTILVIDDEPDIIIGQQTALERAGYRVLTAGDGQSGIALALHERPDLVIVDMMMPRQSGFVVLERLKEHFGTDFPVIMMTANAADEQRAYAEFLGVDAYLLKPITAEQLLITVRRCLPLVEQVEAVNGSILDTGILPSHG